ncbi:MAG: DNA-3-methyladenine glycosylase 2 family protein [Hydrogenophaga sp.]|jgi:DNA-3-methyladenine glycosylase II|uniref:DNA-3-methyladenine glycosylase family protein n=1 Tax=Hydrogenophaga sp. TaxID=1904254 RepID=UPI0027258C2E|nr:DNA-3-methyladenine glycosylase 2 family protein [Hydrogenophaga sp.]MDO9479065.1 DNA-3-methyladenine glycosylase 2 family protein [Hydrogenophaga sp.]MDP2219154.1 DNA-3-methyladenine glycosylase 2 family protein [Hydrogenophaga sp.]MDP3346217.1 DNA-3-methyladenine glycosylase 2 family protein [Hydrogenophaga sp.]MDP3808852.1 DNA-3-methyladenine glycosylase 2 family protein [Hydrogenophaga sp.]MDP3925343.1 DNA-3-methyladenine glycosylase 2 family protein [Hydrogenophaga sp.]
MALAPLPDVGPGAPAYWQEACRHLMKRDRVMKKLIPQHTGVSLESRGDAFVTLARSIVGQQISVKAAQSVWDRFALLPQAMVPAQVLKLKVDDMRAAGLSARKVEYLVDLALHFANDQVHVNAWADMDDESIIAELVAIRGIGRWTAEMFLIFHLMRPNVLPLDDVGLQNGISRCYFSGEPVSRSEIREVAASWAPFCSVATWYIWRSLDPAPVAY